MIEEEETCPQRNHYVGQRRAHGMMSRRGKINPSRGVGKIITKKVRGLLRLGNELETITMVLENHESFKKGSSFVVQVIN